MLTAKQHRLSLPGLTMSVVEAGVGLPLVLVHGFPMDHTIWQAQIDALSAQCRVIAPDLRGFGSSLGELEAVSMRRYADDLAAMLEALHIEEPVILAGLSMGGYIAFEFFRAHRPMLKALILCDTRAAPDTPQGATSRRETANRLEQHGNSFLAETMLPRLLWTSTYAHRPEVPEQLREIISAGDPLGQAAASRAMANRIDSTPWLSRIDCPALLIVGRHDAISTLNEMNTMAQKIPGSQLVEIDDAGHMSPMENPTAVTAAIADFIFK
jgi:pimeloyl-ACP methyl ester carboxylesterase